MNIYYNPPRQPSLRHTKRDGTHILDNVFVERARARAKDTTQRHIVRPAPCLLPLSRRSAICRVKNIKYLNYFRLIKHHPGGIKKDTELFKPVALSIKIPGWWSCRVLFGQHLGCFTASWPQQLQILLLYCLHDDDMNTRTRT